MADEDREIPSTSTQNIFLHNISIAVENFLRTWQVSGDPVGLCQDAAKELIQETLRSAPSLDPSTSIGSPAFFEALNIEQWAKEQVRKQQETNAIPYHDLLGKLLLLNDLAVSKWPLADILALGSCLAQYSIDFVADVLKPYVNGLA